MALPAVMWRRYIFALGALAGATAKPFVNPLLIPHRSANCPAVLRDPSQLEPQPYSPSEIVTVLERSQVKMPIPLSFHGQITTSSQRDFNLTPSPKFHSLRINRFLGRDCKWAISDPRTRKQSRHKSHRASFEYKVRARHDNF